MDLQLTNNQWKKQYERCEQTVIRGMKYENDVCAAGDCAPASHLYIVLVK